MQSVLGPSIMEPLRLKTIQLCHQNQLMNAILIYEVLVNLFFFKIGLDLLMFQTIYSSLHILFRLFTATVDLDNACLNETLSW